jgi:hypothetical protein
MKKASYQLSVVSCLALFVLLGCRTYSQSPRYLAEDKKKIVGTWENEEGGIRFTFTADNKYMEYYSGKSDTYVYKITPANSECGKVFGVTNLADTTAVFIQLNDVKTKARSCLLLDGVSDSTLSFAVEGTLRPALYIKKPPLKEK